MKTLRRGARGSEVKSWQAFLLGQQFPVGVIDGIFGPKTDAQTREFQRAQGLVIDGIVGPMTYGRAMQLGFDPLEMDENDAAKTGPNWPPQLAGIRSPSAALRSRLFGSFEYRAAPTRWSPEGIKILGNWQKKNIVRVTIPQLQGVVGAHDKGIVFFHRAGVEALKRTSFAQWEAEGLLPLLRTWAGSFVPRFIRGSRTILSNHAYGTAFDINVPWNPLGARPALVGKPGSVRELVPIAQEHGFAWGGHYRRRPDGMHFELAKHIDFEDEQ